MPRRAIVEGLGLAKALGPYSRAVWAGELLYISGQTGIDGATGRLVEGGAGAETARVLENLSVVLRVAGLSFADVVKSNVYLVDIQDFAAMNQVYQKYFEEPYPARTTVAVNALPGGAKVEIELVAAATSNQ